MTITLPCLMIEKMPQTKVKYFVLVFLTKCFIPITHQTPFKSAEKFKYNDHT